jgi:glucosamine--fructose-6-phosphate aminotransferase (isomerizing)
MSIAFAMLALHIGRLHDLSILEGRRIVAGLRQLPEQIAEILASEADMAEVAKDLDAAASAFYIGRVRGFAVAREGAQKLKEISYIHAEAYQTSELKHGPLALIEESMPTVAIVPDDDLKERNLAALEQVRARGGRFIAISHPDVEFGAVEGAVVRVPKNETELDPILLTIPTQFLAYYAALSRGLDIDKPRNLAKAVTVE